MTIEKFIEQNFPIQCIGRDKSGKEVLSEAVDVEVRIYKRPDSNMISSSVKCPYNTGGSGQRCKASHPEVDKVGDGINCPYSFDIPYALDNRGK